MSYDYCFENSLNKTQNVLMDQPRVPKVTGNFVSESFFSLVSTLKQLEFCAGLPDQDGNGLTDPGTDTCFGKG